MFSRGLHIACAALLTVTVGLGLSAEAYAQFKTKAKYAILVDVDTNSVLFEKDADELMPPASMSKLMTLAMIFRALKEGRLSLDDEFTVSVNAWRTGGAPSGTSAMFAPLNTSVTLNDLLQGIIVQSGNDACIIVAEGMSGTEEEFSELMTKYARKIGLKKSTFRNSTGLPHPDHLMTARDLATLSIYLIKEFPDFYPMFKQREFKYRRHRFYNRNPLVFSGFADGLKTGFISASGYGITASATSRGQRLVAVVNGLKTKRERQSEARKLLEWGFRSFKQWKLFDANETVGEALVWGGEKRYVPLVGKGDVHILLPRTSNRRIRASIVYQGPLKPPIKKGDQVAILRVVTPQQTTNEVPLYAAEDIGSSGIVKRGLESLLHLAFGWIL